MNLFDHMSKEALQAIKETKSEMGTLTQLRKTTVTPSKDCNEQDNLRKETTPVSEDSDSAIGTSSSLTSARMNSGSEENSLLPPAGEFCVHNLDSGTKLETKPRPKTCGEFAKLERIRPSIVSMDTPIVKRHSLPGKGQRDVLPSTSNSQWIHTSPMMSSHWVNQATCDFDKMNVFERLSSPSKSSYTITARQRSNARLSLSMKRKEIRENSKPSIMFIQREGSKSAIPAINRQRSQSLPRKDTSAQKSLNTLIARPIPPNYYYKPTYERPSDYDIIDDYIPELEARPFEITPPGYDYRFAAMKYDDVIGRPAHSEDEEESCEIIKHAKIKCRQWLAHQMSILTDST